MKRLRDAGLELDLNDERVLREAGLDSVRLQASTEDGLIAALARVPADALIVQWRQK